MRTLFFILFRIFLVLCVVGIGKELYERGYQAGVAKFIRAECR